MHGWIRGNVYFLFIVVTLLMLNEERLFMNGFNKGAVKLIMVTVSHYIP